MHTLNAPVDGSAARAIARHPDRDSGPATVPLFSKTLGGPALEPEMTAELRNCKADGCGALVFDNQTYCQDFIAHRRRHNQSAAPTSSRRRFQLRELGFRKRRRR